MEVIRDTAIKPLSSYGVSHQDSGNPIDVLVPTGVEDSSDVTY
jgi:hypothetical protein